MTAMHADRQNQKSAWLKVLRCMGYALAMVLADMQLAHSGVDLKNGNYFLRADDFSNGQHCGDHPLCLARFYNSVATATGVFGKGWCSELETRLVREGENIVITWCGQGRKYLFKPVAGSEGVWASKDFLLQVLRFRQGKYYLGGIDMTKQRVFDASGRAIQLLGASDADSPPDTPIALIYKEGRLVSLKGKGKPFAKLEYNAEGLVKAVQYGKKLVQYDYLPGGLLGSVKDGEKTLARYAYNQHGRMASNSQASGQTREISYDADGKANKVVEGDCISRFEYQRIPSEAEGMTESQVSARRQCGEAAAQERQVKFIYQKLQSDAMKLVRLSDTVGRWVRDIAFENDAPIKMTWANLNKQDAPPPPAVSDPGAEDKIAPGLDMPENSLEYIYDEFGRIRRISLFSGADTRHLFEKMLGDASRIAMHFDFGTGPLDKASSIQHIFADSQGVEMGNVFYSYIYDQKGQLLMVSKDFEDDIRMAYDLHGVMRSIENNKGEKISIRYDKLFNKPAVLKMHGVVTVYVKRGKHGDVLSVKSVPNNPALAMRIATVFNDMLTATIDNAVIPDVLDRLLFNYIDPVFDQDQLGVIGLPGLKPKGDCLQFVP